MTECRAGHNSLTRHALSQLCKVTYFSANRQHYATMRHECRRLFHFCQPQANFKHTADNFPHENFALHPICRTFAYCRKTARRHERISMSAAGKHH